MFKVICREYLTIKFGNDFIFCPFETSVRFQVDRAVANYNKQQNKAMFLK